MIARRSFLAGFAGLLAAPLVVKADSLMKIRGVALPRVSMRWLTDYAIGEDRMYARLDVLYGRLTMPRFAQGLEPGLIANLERQYAPIIQQMEADALAKPGTQKYLSVALREHFSSDHGKALLGMDGYNGAPQA